MEHGNHCTYDIGHIQANFSKFAQATTVLWLSTPVSESWYFGKVLYSPLKAVIVGWTVLLFINEDKIHLKEDSVIAIRVVGAISMMKKDKWNKGCNMTKNATLAAFCGHENSFKGHYKQSATKISISQWCSVGLREIKTAKNVLA